MRDLLAELTTALEQGRPCIWCSVVETRGSTPQKAGASMLLFPDGSQRGTLGGGCVEADVKRRALGLLGPAGQPEVMTFCLDDDYGWDDGLICGGRMMFLVDPLPAPRSLAYFQKQRELIDSGRGCTEAVVVAASAGNVGSRYLFYASGLLAAQTADGSPPDAVAGGVVPLEQRPGPRLRDGVAYLPVLPRITLLIVGGGHVGQAVGQLAADVDFDVWALDDRERYANQERFPRAERIIVGDIGATLKALAPTLKRSCYCLIVTRGHSHDEEALYHLAASEAGYVGMIGSKRKIRIIYEDLLAKGRTMEQLARVHAPLGFDIGSQTVPEIAVSIVAELIACRNKGTTNIQPRQRAHVDNTER
jgi:xanthine dehydrogenase accessory factor